MFTLITTDTRTQTVKNQSSFTKARFAKLAFDCTRQLADKRLDVELRDSDGQWVARRKRCTS